MTRVALRSGGGRFSLRAGGHALGSPEGCAFLSGVVYALAGFLVNEEAVTVERCRLEPGDVDLRFRGGAEAEVAFRVAAAGLRQLEGSFPQLVRVCQTEDGGL